MLKSTPRPRQPSHISSALPGRFVGLVGFVGIFATFAFACGGAGTSPNDGSGNGNGNTQLTDCTSNPNQCIAHALVSSAPSCTCVMSGGVPLCESGYLYNASQQACISTGGTADAGVSDGDAGSSADVGTNADASTTTDAGTTQSDAGAGIDSGAGADSGVETAECSTDSQCTSIPNGQCASPASSAPCNGICTDGVCIESCDWTQGPTGQCSADGRCVYAGDDLDGFCIEDEGGKALGAACQRTFDAQGKVTADECNTTLNLVCFGATPTNPNGECTALCSVEQTPPGYCGTLGLSCLPVTDKIGVCGEIPSWTDTGKACTTATSCQDSNDRICETAATGGTCSSDCSRTACPTDSICVALSDTGPFICVLDCSDNAATCANRNAALQCYGLEDTVSVCAP